MEEFLAMLNAIRPLSPELMEHLYKMLKEETIRRNHLLIKEGVVNDRFYFVAYGFVRCFYRYKGREITKWVFRPGDVIASTWSFRFQRLGKENMVALSPCRVISSTFPKLEQTYLTFPEFERHGRIVTQRYSSLWYSILDGIRMKTAKERVGFLLDEFPDLVQDIPTKHLASVIDLDKTTFVKIRTQLRK